MTGTEQTETIPQSQGRLASLDALRGFDMLWIIGGGTLVQKVAELTQWPWLKSATIQLEHAEWNGFRFIDLVFPLFLFIAGVALPFSLAKRKEREESKTVVYSHLARRAVILVLLGLVFNGFLKFDWPNARYCSVLGRIGIAWFFAAVIAMNTGLLGQALSFAGLLLGYWAAMTLIPAPGVAVPMLTPEGNLSGYIDRLLLPGKIYGGSYDPEGLLSTIPAIGTALLGCLAGRLLLSQSKWLAGVTKGAILLAAGLVCLAAGWYWGQVFPINKKLWTSSFVLYAGGWSLILLSVFYLIIDVCRLRKWALFFAVIGANSIFIYMCQCGVLPLWVTSEFLFKGLIGYASAAWQPVLSALGYLAVEWVLLLFLYRKKIFLRV